MTYPRRVDARTFGLPLSLAVLCVAFAVFWLATFASAQQVGVPLKQDTGRISGVVTDSSGALVAGARVGLSIDGGPATDVAPGNFVLAITSDGLQTGKDSGVLDPGMNLQLQPIVLRVATATTDVEVNLSRSDLAEAEIQTEEKQRLFGFAPNFYVSYTWNAKPLTQKQKWELSYKTIVDPLTIGISAGVAGIEQATDTFPSWRQDAAGYGKRFGANYGDVVVGTLLGGYVFPVVFHQDPRYFYKGVGSKKRRFFYAMSTAVIARGDNGKWQPAYASLAGDLSAAALSNVYIPASSRNGASLTIANGLLGIAFDGVGNVFQEFVFHKLSTHAPKPIGSQP